MLHTYDSWLHEEGPSALVIREYLIPVEGSDGVLFPATYAAGDGFPGGYNIDTFPDGRNVCLIDSVGSQANRIEPLFAKPEYAGLVPQVVIKAGDRKVNLLEAGHRAGDAIARCSALQGELQDAFKAMLNGNAEPLARIAPTSIVFGVWDSRDTQAKLPRLVASTIRAFDVRRLTRSATYVPAVDYVGQGLLEEPQTKPEKDSYAERGFVHVPASGSHGGVIATGGVRRDACLHLAALRLLRAAAEQTTPVLQRYILGLALTAFTAPPAGYLRQGCHLVLDPEKPRQFQEVYADGRRKDATLQHADALSYAIAAAQAFGLSPNREVDFEPALAVRDLAPREGDASKPKKRTRATRDTNPA